MSIEQIHGRYYSTTVLDQERAVVYRTRQQPLTSVWPDPPAVLKQQPLTSVEWLSSIAAAGAWDPHPTAARRMTVRQALEEAHARQATAALVRMLDAGPPQEATVAHLERETADAYVDAANDVDVFVVDEAAVVAWARARPQK